MKEILEQPSTKPASEPLTAREVEVLQLLAKGLSNDEIAAQLVISEVTVRTHISHLLAKLHMANRVQATLYALREGITSIEEEKRVNPVAPDTQLLTHDFKYVEKLIFNPPYVDCNINSRTMTSYLIAVKLRLYELFKKQSLRAGMPY